MLNHKHSKTEAHVGLYVLSLHRSQLMVAEAYTVALWEKCHVLGCQLFYHAMHFSAKRGIAIACRLSVRL